MELTGVRQVIAGAQGELKADACVNLGNASCAWAEVLDTSPESLRLLGQAQQAYQQAASLDPEDASVGRLVPLLLGSVQSQPQGLSDYCHI